MVVSLLAHSTHRRTRNRVAALLILPSLLSCGGGQAPQATLAPIASASAQPAPSVPTAAAAPARGQVSDALKRRWPFDAQPQLAVYVDMKGLLGTELFGGFFPALLNSFKGQIGPDAAECAQQMLASVSELFVGSDDRGELFALTFDPKQLRTSVAKCAALGGYGPAQVDGADEAYRNDKTLVAIQGGTILAGPQDLVTVALQSPAGPWPSGLSLDANQYVAFSAHLDRTRSLTGAVSESTERFRIDVDANVSPDDAKGVQAMVHLAPMAAGQKMPKEQAQILAHLLDSLKVSVDGGHVRGTFELAETVTDQAKDLGAAAALATYAVRSYLTNAKQAEARNTVGQIAKDIATAYESEDPPGGKPHEKKRLASFPPVPKAIPSGTKVATTPADWKAWAPIQFEMDAPQFYQYEVRASKDGMSAEILARGDLNGDGKPSTFRVRLKIDPKTHALNISPNIEEQDADE